MAISARGGLPNEDKLKIPGLISKDNESINMQRTTLFESVEKMKQMVEAKSYSHQGTTAADPNFEWKQGNLIQHQYIPPNYIPNQINTYPSRKQPSYFDEEIMKEMMRHMEAGIMKKPAKPLKSDFEIMIEALFTTAEKEQLLIDMGYEISVDGKSNLKISRKLSDGTIKIISNSLEDLFLKEITVKFKNLLLAKATLKLKL